MGTRRGRATALSANQYGTRGGARKQRYGARLRVRDAPRGDRQHTTSARGEAGRLPGSANQHGTRKCLLPCQQRCKQRCQQRCQRRGQQPMLRPCQQRQQRSQQRCQRRSQRP